MNVRTLIQKLQECDQDATVFIYRNGVKIGVGEVNKTTIDQNSFGKAGYHSSGLEVCNHPAVELN